MKKKIKTYDNWKLKKVHVTNLFLDPENIRIEVENKSQDALIADLFANEDAIQILHSIVEDGFFPDEKPIVVEENDKYIVVEGNRRVASLKVMLNPNLAGEQKSKVEKILRGSSAIREIEVLVTPDRSSVNKLLAVKHTTVTRRPWKPLRQAYFYHAQLGKGKKLDDLRKDYPNVDIPKFIKMWEVHKIARSLQYDSEIIARKVYNQRTFPVSTIERLYDDTKFREYLGFDFDKNGMIQISTKKDSFEKALKKVIIDAVEKKIDTRKLGNENKREKYFKGLKKPKRTKGRTTKSDDFTPKEPPPAVKSRINLVPKDIISSLKSPGIERRLIELQSIPYEKFPNAAHDLLRSFLELTLKKYFDSIGQSLKTEKRKVYLEAALNAMERKAQRDGNLEIEQVVKTIKTSKWVLDCINHNPSVFSTGEKVRDQWDEMEALIRYLLK